MDEDIENPVLLVTSTNPLCSEAGTDYMLMDGSKESVSIRILRKISLIT